MTTRVREHLIARRFKVVRCEHHAEVSVSALLHEELVRLLTQDYMWIGSTPGVVLCE